MRKPSAETVQSRRAYIAKHAEGDFANHVLVQQEPSRWVCRNPKGVGYWFFVVIGPQMVLVYGDVGELILRPSEDMTGVLGWLVGCLTKGKEDTAWPEVDYVLSKAPHKKREFLNGEVQEYMDSLLKEHPWGEVLTRSRVAQIKDLYESNKEESESDGDMSNDTLRCHWRKAYYEVTDDPEIPDCDDWDREMLMCYQALRTFVRLYQAAKVDAPTPS
jgi:hypothetical protein